MSVSLQRVFFQLGVASTPAIHLTQVTSQFLDILPCSSAWHDYRILLLPTVSLCDQFRDLSLENILLHNNQPMIVDFGMALIVGQPQSGHGMGAAGGIGIVSSMGQSGKKRYMAPEVAMNMPSFDGFAVDIWACGVILYM